MLPACLQTDRFLSTPSARRATFTRLSKLPPQRISIHALREEGDYLEIACSLQSLISIHALREEGDIDATPPALYP